MSAGPGQVSARVDTVVAELRRRRRRDWTVAARAVEQGIVVRGGAAERRVDDSLELTVEVHEDSGRGRGSGRVTAEGASSDARDLVDAALARARANVGPAWTTPPPSAPARVVLVDADLIEGKIDDLAAGVAASVERAAAGVGAVDVERVRGEVARVHDEVATGQGFRLAWSSTRLAMDAHLVVDGEGATIAAAARRRVGLDVDNVVIGAVARARARTAARPVVAGRYDVVLTAGAMLADEELGIWRLVTAQADGARARQGLTRYQRGDEVAPGSAALGEPLTVISDGTIAWGLGSAPVGEAGEPVRRFTLVDRGRALDLALDPREAAARGVTANGGVRDLRVLAGTTTRDRLRQVREGVPVLEVEELTWLELDEGSGFALAEIKLARVRVNDGGGTVVRGGWLRGDGLAWLAGATRSREVVDRGRYHGPVALRVDALDVV